MFQSKETIKEETLPPTAPLRELPEGKLTKDAAQNTHWTLQPEKRRKPAICSSMDGPEGMKLSEMTQRKINARMLLRCGT